MEKLKKAIAEGLKVVERTEIDGTKIKSSPHYTEVAKAITSHGGKIVKDGKYLGVKYRDSSFLDKLKQSWKHSFQVFDHGNEHTFEKGTIIWKLIQTDSGDILGLEM